MQLERTRNERTTDRVCYARFGTVTIITNKLKTWIKDYGVSLETRAGNQHWWEQNVTIRCVFARSWCPKLAEVMLHLIRQFHSFLLTLSRIGNSLSDCIRWTALLSNEGSQQSETEPSVDRNNVDCIRITNIHIGMLSLLLELIDHGTYIFSAWKHKGCGWVWYHFDGGWLCYFLRTCSGSAVSRWVLNNKWHQNYGISWRDISRCTVKPKLEV